MSVALAFVFLLVLGPQPARAQILADPVLSGRVLLGDSALTSGTVVLHRVATESQGEVDSMRVGRDGGFSFRLPSVPDPGRSELYFASVRHAGILYFGSAVTLPVQLDSLYEIRTYDTLMAPEPGIALPVQARNLFLEEEDGFWQVTDLLQVRYEGDRTVVAREGGAVWRYPLPPGAMDPSVVEGDFGVEALDFQEGDVVVRSALPPGERLFVVRYTLPDPFLSIPLPGETETLEVLVREPAPPLEVPLLVMTDRVELEAGTTYRRFSGTGLSDQVVRFVQGTTTSPPPVRWLTVILALLMTGAGLWAVQRGSDGPATASAGDVTSRQALLVRIARLDEDFESHGSTSPEERGAYDARRLELLRRLQNVR
jgi:hypothetical protein